VVPALFNTDHVTKDLKRDERSLTDIIIEAEERRRVIPAKGERFLNEALEKKQQSQSTQGSENPNTNDAISRWEHILDRYQIRHHNLSPENDDNMPNTEDKHDDLDELLDFDD
jgi:hypothetical protein